MTLFSAPPPTRRDRAAVRAAAGRTTSSPAQGGPLPLRGARVSGPSSAASRRRDVARPGRTSPSADAATAPPGDPSDGLRAQAARATIIDDPARWSSSPSSAITRPRHPSSATATLADSRRARAEARRRERGRRARPWLVGLALLLLVAPAAWTWLAAVPQPMDHAEHYPGTAPREWGPGAAWVTPSLLPGVRAVGLGERTVAIVTAERRLALVDADGTTRWADDLPDGDLHAGPTRTRIDGQEVVLAHVGTTLAWWTLDSGAHTRIDLPPAARVSLDGEVPLVVLDPTHVQALTRVDAPQVAIPAGVRPLAAHADGRVTVVSATGWGHVGPDSGDRFGRWETHSTAPGVVAGYAQGRIVLVRGGARPTVEVHADRAADVRFLFAEPITLPQDHPGRVTWHLSPSKSWGVLGRTLVDLAGGSATDLGPWTTSSVLVDRAYGVVERQRVITGPLIPPGVLDDAEAVPEVVLTDGALVRAPAPPTVGGAPAVGDRLYFLPNRKVSS